MRPAQVSSDDERRDAAKRTAARAFDRAIRACGYSNDAVASILLVSVTRVRKMRSDDDADLDVVPSAADIVLADHALGERFLQELRAERLALHGAPPAVTKEQKTHRAMGAAASFVATASQVVEDGVVEPHEEPALQQKAQLAITEIEGLAALLRLGDK
jgi:hypothetical protein